MAEHEELTTARLTPSRPAPRDVDLVLGDLHPVPRYGPTVEA
ncbi:hypothetical protein [Micromonospora sp. RP3T]|nr:hypothetical protein [Micromonospora sp. RP3T]